MAYGAEVMQLGEDVVGDIAKRHGAIGLIHLVADIAVRVPLEYLSEMRRDSAVCDAGSDQVARLRAGGHYFHGTRNGVDHEPVQLEMAVYLSGVAGSGER